jgi:hypothetical protein
MESHNMNKNQVSQRLDQQIQVLLIYSLYDHLPKFELDQMGRKEEMGDIMYKLKLLQ